MRALRQRGGQGVRRPRGRPARHPIPAALSRAALRRLAARDRLRAEQAEDATSALQRRFDEQARELAEARARIAELERLLAEARGEHDEQGAEGGKPASASPEGASDGPQAPDSQPGGPNEGQAPRPRPASSRPGIMEVRRQLSQALASQAELRALVEELRRLIATLERRCAELEQQLKRALSLDEGSRPPESGHPRAEDRAAQERASILTIELEQVRRERTEAADQRDRLLARLTDVTLSIRGVVSGPCSDYNAARTELFTQMRVELEERDLFAQWEVAHRPRETDRRLKPTQTLDEQALVATITVRWQLMDHAPHSYRHQPRWVVEGILLDPASEQFLIKQSRERVAYRKRMRTAAGVP